jgi:hypothetical protein
VEKVLERERHAIERRQMAAAETNISRYKKQPEVMAEACETRAKRWHGIENETGSR